MTRAKEKLIITAAFPDAGKEIDKLSKLSGPIQPQTLKSIKYMAGWILLPMLNVSSEPGARNTEETDAKMPWSLSVVPASDGKPVESETGVQAELERFAPQTISHDAALVQKNIETLSERFSYVYPHRKAADLPSKLTVTGLKGKASDSELSEAAYYYADDVLVRTAPLTDSTSKYSSRKPPPDPSPDPEFRVPEFRMESELRKPGSRALSAAERGTALHLAMQYIDYNKCGSAAGIRDEVAMLAQKGLLADEQADSVDIEKIARFFASETGKRAMRAQNIRREFRFSLLYPAERFYPGGGEDEILLQGVIDCFFEDGSELVVVDFKTDRITQDTIGERAASYAPQLNTYSDALERITGKRVKERIIYFFAPGVCVKSPKRLSFGEISGMLR